jgi:hypothetical protein
MVVEGAWTVNMPAERRRNDAGTPPRTPADALTTARVGFAYLDGLRF